MGPGQPNSSPAQLRRFRAVNTKMKTKSRSAQSVLRVNQQNAHSVVVLTETGNRLMGQGEFKQAQECFQSALDLLIAGKNTQDKRTAIAYYNLARANAALENLETAVGYYEAAILIRPRFPEALNNLGMLRNDLGQFEQAIEHFKIVIGAEPLFLRALWSGQTSKPATTPRRRSVTRKPLRSNLIFRRGQPGLICIKSAARKWQCIVTTRRSASPGNAELYFQPTAILTRLPTPRVHQGFRI